MEGSTKPEPSAGVFPNTRWSLVLELGEGGAPAERALEELCAIYWYPVYAYLRSSGAAPADAEDMAQGFFVRLIGREILARADASKGRLRCYLLHALKHFKIDEHRKSMAQKRGGGIPDLRIDADTAEERYVAEPAHRDDPEAIFERRWALALLGEAFARLESEYSEAGKAELYQVLQPYLAGTPPDGGTHADAAGKLGMSQGAVQVAVHRMRKRYRLALEAAIAETVETEGEVAGELDHVLQILAKGK